MFLRFFGWVMATRGRKGDKGGKGRADVSRLGTKRRAKTGETGRERGKEERPSMAATRTKGTREREERPKTAATRTKGTREREERPSMAATRTRGKGTKGGQGRPRRGHERGRKGGKRGTRRGRGSAKGGQRWLRLKTWHRHISSPGSNEGGLLKR